MNIDVATIDGIIKAYYEIVSVAKGQPRNFAEDKFIHSKNPLILLPIGENNSFVQLTIDEYHERRGKIADKSFYEREIHRVTEQFGNMVHIWSTYEWDRGSDSDERGRGINSIQLYYSDKRWWISSWFFVSEDKDNPIPKKYLP